jgi:hypothetical protein
VSLAKPKDTAAEAAEPLREPAQQLSPLPRRARRLPGADPIVSVGVDDAQSDAAADPANVLEKILWQDRSDAHSYEKITF